MAAQARYPSAPDEASALRWTWPSEIGPVDERGILGVARSHEHAAPPAVRRVGFPAQPHPWSGGSRLPLVWLGGTNMGLLLLLTMMSLGVECGYAGADIMCRQVRTRAIVYSWNPEYVYPALPEDEPGKTLR